jgi:23S rRNA pseudoU1915 N3-methylase RlmH
MMRLVQDWLKQAADSQLQRRFEEQVSLFFIPIFSSRQPADSKLQRRLEDQVETITHVLNKTEYP